jgi:hypothetical protein
MSGGRRPGQQPEKPEDAQRWEVHKRPSEERQGTEDKRETAEWEKAKEKSGKDD